MPRSETFEDYAVGNDRPSKHTVPKCEALNTKRINSGQGSCPCQSGPPIVCTASRPQSTPPPGRLCAHCLPLVGSTHPLSIEIAKHTVLQHDGSLVPRCRVDGLQERSWRKTDMVSSLSHDILSLSGTALPSNTKPRKSNMKRV